MAAPLPLRYVFTMNVFVPKLDILPNAQRQLWSELAEIPPEFTLYGGTAVALHLGHRQSIDFDFFGTDHFSPLDLLSSLQLLKGSEVIQSAPNTLTAVVHRDGPVKLSFFGVPRIKPVFEPVIAEDIGLKIASLLDLAGTKAAVVQQRAEAKDYIDIDAILASGQVNLRQALNAAQQIYGSSFAPQNTLKALTYFDEPDLEALPQVLKMRLVMAVRALDQRTTHP
jgi:Nucleotidyl transferase AbiEii toxin, Type IV TA system